MSPNETSISGVIAIDKPIGKSSGYLDYSIKSHLAKLLGLSKKKSPKVGHAGTLDPFATGVMVLAIGNSTKDLPLLDTNSKSYMATIRIGWSTVTDDNTGEDDYGLPHIEILFTDNEIIAALEQFKGTFMQLPCLYSAKKIDGERAYNQARNNLDATTESVGLKPVQVTVHSLELISIARPESKAYIDVTISCTVSAGTFIRAIARDLGNALGPGAHLIALRRTQVGEDWSEQNCLQLSDILATETIQEFAQLLTHYPTGTALTFGTFDGVHLGHQKLISETVKTAVTNNQRSIVLIIDRETQVETQSETQSETKPEDRITTISGRANYIESLCVNEVHILNLQDIKNLDYTDFLNSITGQYNVKTIVMADSMHFGKDCQGNVQNSREYFQNKSIAESSTKSNTDPNPKSNAKSTPVSVLEIPELGYLNKPHKISSSTIREKIASGEVNVASNLLGKFYKIDGVVVRGYGRGKDLGFPTANIADIQTLIPGDGVYFGSLQVQKDRHPAIISIGSNPTFDNPKRTVEVNVPGVFDLEIYDKHVRVSFEAKMRDMVRFNNIEELKAQLNYDTNLALAAWALQNDGIVATDTDTVLGLLISTKSPQAKQKLYDVKQRDKSKPFQILVNSLEEAKKYGNFNQAALELATSTWGADNGAQTIVVPSTDSFKKTTGMLTVGIRVPSHSNPHSGALNGLLNLFQPVFATSANISNEPPPSTINEVREIFGERIDFYLNSLPPNVTSVRADASLSPNPNITPSSPSIVTSFATSEGAFRDTPKICRP